MRAERSSTPVNAYRRNVFRHLTEVLAPVAPVERALDFGCGDGWFARELGRSGLARRVVAVEVLRRRRRRLVEPVLYDGRRLPFADRSFDLVYAVDVLHHTPDPPAALRELLRCCRSHFVLKDHTHRSRLGRWTLALLDEVGNRRFGVSSLYNYQRDWEWLPVIEDAGLTLAELRHPVVVERRPVLSWFVNEFQFVGRWRRRPEPGSTRADAPPPRARSLGAAVAGPPGGARRAPAGRAGGRAGGRAAARRPGRPRSSSAAS